MIYLILYAVKAANGETVGGLYFGWANNLTDAEKLFADIVLTPSCFRKEIWADDGKGYRKLWRTEKYDARNLPC